jgi:hypothetical protein
MIRMNRVMRQRAEEETDRLIPLVDPQGVLGLRALVDAARQGDGAAQVKEHDLIVLVERVRRREVGAPNGYPNGVSDPHPSWRAYSRLEEMG